MESAAARERCEPYIYLAGPWTPVCGGIFKVVDYLIQSHAPPVTREFAHLRPLDTRSGGHAFFSSWFLFVALLKILVGRIQGGLAGVHVNIAERLSLVRKGTMVVWCHTLGIPVVLHLHAQMRNFYLGLPSPFQRMTRWVFALADGVVVIGPAARRFVIDELHVPADRVELVFNGVPEPVEPHRDPLHEGTQQLLFLGRLADAKGLPELLQALARPGFDPKTVRLTVAGGGDIARYQAQAKSLGIADRVHFEGLCDQAKVTRLLAASDLLVLPSHDEVLPLVILEALASSVPVVCTPVGEIPSVLCDGVNALFVAPRDVTGLADVLQNVLAQPSLKERLGRNGRILYEQRFSMPGFFAAIARIHQRHFGIAARPRHLGPAGAHHPDPSHVAVRAPVVSGASLVQDEPRR